MTLDQVTQFPAQICTGELCGDGDLPGRIIQIP